MKLVAAYLLAVLGGKANPEEADIKNILSSVGVEADSERLSKLLSELKGKDVYALIDAGSEKLASFGGQVAAAGGGAAAAGAASAGGETPAEEKKEEPAEEEEESDEVIFPSANCSLTKLGYGIWSF